MSSAGRKWAWAGLICQWGQTILAPATVSLDKLTVLYLKVLQHSGGLGSPLVLLLLLLRCLIPGWMERTRCFSYLWRSWFISRKPLERLYQSADGCGDRCWLSMRGRKRSEGHFLADIFINEGAERSEWGWARLSHSCSRVLLYMCPVLQEHSEFCKQSQVADQGGCLFHINMEWVIATCSVDQVVFFFALHTALEGGEKKKLCPQDLRLFVYCLRALTHPEEIATARTDCQACRSVTNVWSKKQTLMAGPVL